MRSRLVVKETVSVAVAAVLVVLLSMPLGPLPPLGDLLNPNGGVWTVAGGANHPAMEELRILGLDGDVTVLRDTWGVPHIFATTNHDLFFALGYVHAQDRMWQMDIQYRFAAGRLSEVLGPKYVEQDAFLRTVGLARMADRYLATLPPADPSLLALDAYAAGVNAWIGHTPGRDLPLEYRLLGYAPEAWSPTHSLTEGGLLAYGLSADFTDLELGLLTDRLGAAAVDELFPIASPIPVPPIVPNGTRGGGPVIDPLAARDILAKARLVEPFLGPLRAGIGSNNWVVAAANSSTGRPLLAGDPHLSFQLPAIWYEAHLRGGDYDVYGVTLPGTPGVFIGFNRDVAWSETNTGADVTDFYVESVNPSNPDEYLFQGQWRTFVSTRDVIRVKGGADVPVTVQESVHGPLVTRRGETVAMRWTGNATGSAIGAALRFMKAANWTEFRDALREWENPAQNFVFASWGGSPAMSTIAIRSNGLFPIRENNITGRVPLDCTGAFEWTGWVPFGEAPEAVDPPEGYLASANQIPAGQGYPHYLGWQWDPGYRARRINELLNGTLAANGTVSPDDMRAFQRDTLDVLAREFVPYIVAANSACGTPVCSVAINVLESWDFRMEADRAGASVWYGFIHRFIDDTFGDEWAAANVSDVMMPYPDVLERLVTQAPGSPWFDDVTTPAIETRDDIIRRALGEAAENLAARLGPEGTQWIWGRLHTRVFDSLSGLDALSRGPYPAEGDDITLDPAAGYEAHHGPSLRMVVTLGTPEDSTTVYPGGQSGNPVSPHYDDQLQLWLRREYKDIEFPTSAALPTGHLESTLILRRA
ncbi:MAG: penicillin acylase family protein [Methanobacteriota archaeon]|nr:MAG: penicillin acylase family protein [Euryarchaeota archaeon]